MTAASSESLSRFRPSPSPRWAIRKATSGDRTIAWTLLGLTLPWLAYTRFYFWLQPRHLTFDGGLLMWLFNKPDPTCGLTRTFAWMWRGDLAHAVAVYPLGPLAFAASFPLLGMPRRCSSAATSSDSRCPCGCAAQ